MAANVNETSAATAAKKVKKSDSALKKFFKFCKKNPTFALGLAIMLVIVIVALFAEQIAPHDPTINNPKMSLLKPFTDPEYPLGTDYIGRCLLSRMIFGIRTSALLCVTAVIAAVALGVSVGILSGMGYPGKTDNVLMRVVDVQMGFPFIVLVIILISLFGQSYPALILVLAIGITYSGSITIGIVSLSGLAVASIVGIVLNAVLPGKDYDFAQEDEGSTSVNFKV